MHQILKVLIFVNYILNIVKSNIHYAEMYNEIKIQAEHIY
jgi:hypothetical protein